MSGVARCPSTDDPAGQRSGRSHALRGEHGVATAFHVGVVAMGAAAASAVLVWTGACAERSRTEVAASLSALAAADLARGVAPVGAGDPCGVAAEVAQRNGTAVERCQVVASATGGTRASVEVTVRSADARGAAGWLPLPRAEATAWAGAPPDEWAP